MMIIRCTKMSNQVLINKKNRQNHLKLDQGHDIHR
jgi:hypothetical protein